MGGAVQVQVSEVGYPNGTSPSGVTVVGRPLGGSGVGVTRGDQVIISSAVVVWCDTLQTLVGCGGLAVGWRSGVDRVGGLRKGYGVDWDWGADGTVQAWPGAAVLLPVISILGIYVGVNLKHVSVNICFI